MTRINPDDYIRPTTAATLAGVSRALAYRMVKDGTVPEREATALLEVDSVRLAAKLAEAELRILRSEIRILENRIDVGRSVVGVLRMEANLAR